MRAIPALLLLGACDGDPGGEPEDTGPFVVVQGPRLDVELPSDRPQAGEPVPVEVTATDDDGVLSVTAYVRTVGEAAWETVALEPGEHAWTGEIPGSQVEAPAIELYFKAVDDSAYQAVGYLPEQGLDAPFTVEVERTGEGLPFVEDFEGGGNVFQLGWLSYTQGFAGYEWGLTTSRSASGDSAVVHRRGAQGVAEMDDWLVSPALDLRGVERIEVTWREHGDHVQAADHSLWISTGSPDPAHGDYELVQELPPPVEDTWSRSPVVDLSTWAGERSAHLAWRYRGAFSDVWTLDDVSVREMGPDLRVPTVSWTPVEPGGRTTVTVAVDNRTPVDAADVVLTAETAAERGAFLAPVEIGEIPGGQGVSVDLVLDVAADHPDNARLPFTLTAASGDASWTFDLDLVVGETSEGRVGLDLDADAFVSARLGRGDPASPDVVVPVVSGQLAAGAHELTVDLTEHWAYLPPGPGLERWWLAVESSAPGTLGSLSITHDGTTYTSDDTGAFPATDVTRFHLPRPAEPVVVSRVVDPSPPEPGDTVALDVRLRNDGFTTVGPTTVTVTSDDPDVVVGTPGPIPLAADGWMPGDIADLAIGFDLLPSQDDSRPVPLTLTVQDAVESFPVRVDVPVPWPVLQVTGVVVDDWALGDDDGLLSSGETAHLELQVTNVGDRDTFGAVDCTLSQAGGDATAEIPVASGNLGTLASGASRSEDDFQVRVTDGAPGDTLELALDCSDGGHTYRADVTLALGEVPFVSITPTWDPVGDAQQGYSFDYVRGSYRSDGETLTLRLTSATPYDPSTLFLEAWMRSTGAPYTYYQLVSQSGALTLRGYRLNAYTRLTEPVLTEIDAYTVEIAIELAPLSLVLDTLDVGFASGFCGGATYYCDHFPDGWGNPYQSGLVTTRWVTLSW